jgi:hypothetical protein
MLHFHYNTRITKRSNVNLSGNGCEHPFPYKGKITVMKGSINHKSIICLISISLLIILTSCTPGTSISTSQTVETDISVEEPTATVQAPTETPAVPTAMLIVAEDADPNMVTNVQDALISLAEAEGLNLEVQTGALPEMLPSNVNVVVSVGPGLDINGLAPFSLETKFIVIGNPDAVPAENLSVIGDPAVEAQQQAFMAGYLAAVISSDYKIGGLFSSGASSETMDAFVIGAEFFCGLCKPQYPPYFEYPQTEILAPGSSNDVVQTTVDILASNAIEVLYLQGELVSPELLTYLSTAGIKVVSDSPPDMSRINWVGTVSPDPASALPGVWEDMLAGSGGVLVPAPIILLDAEAGLVSEGRMKLFDEMSAALEDGLVATEIVP